MLIADVEADRGGFALHTAVSVAPGERLALFGPSGAGKTTFLEAVAGLVPLRRGRVVLGGRVLASTEPPATAVPPWQRRVGLLRQDPGLFPHLPVRANLGYSRRGQGKGGGQAAGSEITGIAERLGIGGLLSAMPARLSGGQAHRVALGRLLLADCDALLLDEPYSGLDAALRRTLASLVADLIAERRVPAIMVAHELPDAQAFADRLAVLDQGRLLQAGTPREVVLRPASRRVAELVGYLGFVPVPGIPAGTVAAVHPDRVIGGAHPGRGIVLSGTLAGRRPAGAGWEADLRVGRATVVCRMPELPAAEDGRLTVTALDPPCFGPGGAALPPAREDGDGDGGYLPLGTSGSSPTMSPPPCPQVR